MIVLENIYLEYSDDEVFLKADCIIDNQPETLWYSTSKDNAKYISTSNADAFLLVLFIYCNLNKIKLKSMVPISAELKYGLLELLLPSFNEMGFDSMATDFEFENVDDTVFPEAKGTGAAMSFGVDSFYTYLINEDSTKAVDTITLFNAGAFGQYGGEKAEELFEFMKDRVARFSKEMNKNFIYVNTNLNEKIKMPFLYTYTYRNFACLFVLQKYFKDYLFASGITLSEFALKIDAAGYYDLLISKAVKGNSLDFHISAINVGRVEKTKLIAESPITYDYLNVCFYTPDNKEREDGKNCSECPKCIRTLVTLDVLGALNKYEKVFNLEKYERNKNYYIAGLLYQKLRFKDTFAQEIFDEMKKQNYTYSKEVYSQLLKLIINKSFKKIKRA